MIPEWVLLASFCHFPTRSKINLPIESDSDAVVDS